MLIEKIQIRLSKLKQILDACPIYKGENEEIKQILNEAPKLLQMAEEAIQSGDPVILEQIDEVLIQAAIDIEWAAGVSKGDETAKRIRDGREASPDLPAKERLLDRLLKFTTTIVDKDTYLELFQEFGGEVDGNRAYMDPGEETEAFSQWLLYDKVIPGQSKVLMDLYAEKEMDRLPPDEQALLKGYLKNWPSVFEVTDINKKKNIYSVKDLLSGKRLKFRDKASARLLKAHEIFFARAIPFNMGKNLYYPLGEILELPHKLWKRLSQDVNEWAKEYYSDNPGGSSKQFFRSINAKLRKHILEVTHSGSGRTNNSSSAVLEKQKVVMEIDSFVKQFKQSHKDINEIVGHPEILNYMTKLKSIMDESRPEEMDFLCSEYDGFYEFALFLENFASVIQKGGMNDLL